MPLAHTARPCPGRFRPVPRVIGGMRTVMHVFCFDLPHSNAPFVPGKGNDKGKVEGLVKQGSRIRDQRLSVMQGPATSELHRR